MNILVNEHGHSDIEEVARCLFTDKCINYEYEYYFELNNEKVKADYCSSNRFGYSSCTYNEIKYTNVSFETFYKGYHYDDTNFYLFTYLIVLMFIFNYACKSLFVLLKGSDKNV